MVNAKRGASDVNVSVFDMTQSVIKQPAFGVNALLWAPRYGVNALLWAPRYGVNALLWAPR